MDQEDELIDLFDEALANWHDAREAINREKSKQQRCEQIAWGANEIRNDTDV